METENKFLEFKQNKTTSYLKTVTAFANYGDGEIRFGINDRGAVVPLDSPSSLALDLENQINDCIKPRPDYSIQTNPNGTVSIFVRKGPNTPYCYRDKAYKRNGTSTVEVDSLELRRLVLNGENITFDEVPFHSNQSLTFEVLAASLKTNAGILKLDENILRTLNLLTGDEFNNAAALLADNNGFPGLDIVVFGQNLNIFKERHTLAGLSLIEQFNKAIEVFERNYVYERITGTARERIEIIPATAFREAIANALIHRTYDFPANTKVSMYKDKIEITSPGGLFQNLTVEQFQKGAFSVSRNPVVLNVMHRLHIAEAFATGIKRISESYSRAPIKPRFFVDESSVTVELPSLEELPALTAAESNVLDAMKENRRYARSELESLTGMTKDTLIRKIKGLLDSGLIEKKGKGRAVFYQKK